jgi:hypothetical protein
MIINELLMHDLEFDLCKLAGSGTGVKNPRNVPAKGFEIDCTADRWHSDGSGRTSRFLRFAELGRPSSQLPIRLKHLCGAW